MRVFIYAYEDKYQGLHGVSEQAVAEVRSVREANELANEMAENVVDSWGIWNEEDDPDENEEFFDYGTEWIIYKIRDDVTLSTEELDELCSYEDYREFAKMYCEKEALVD